MITLAWSSRSDVGLRRTNNEDALVAAPPVFAVADGMGGHAAGDVASALAVEGLSHLAGHLSVTRREVLETIRRADDTISRRARDETTAGMGTTLTGLAVTRSDNGTDCVVVFNVGDSRCYLLRDGVLMQISHDHSVVQELVDEGIISSHEAESHPERNVITRSLGAGTPLDIDWWMITPSTGDRYLLCSDGLFKGVSDTTIAQVLAGATDREVAAATLLDAALEAGGTDNISLVLVDVVQAAEPAEPSMLDGDTQPRSLGIDDTNPFATLPPPPGLEASPVLLSSASVESQSAASVAATGPPMLTLVSEPAGRSDSFDGDVEVPPSEASEPTDDATNLALAGPIDDAAAEAQVETTTQAAGAELEDAMGPPNTPRTEDAPS